MFGVGLHFQLKDFMAVRSVAVPGALGQSIIATLATLLVFHLLGWPLRSGLVLGIAMAVASTVVLLRVLMDEHLLHTTHGHIAVGWLFVEDIMTVLVLVLIPVFATLSDAGLDSEDAISGLATIGWAVMRLAALIAIVLLAGVLDSSVASRTIVPFPRWGVAAR